MLLKIKKILFSLICTILLGIASGDLSGIINHEIIAEKNEASYFDHDASNTNKSLA